MIDTYNVMIDLFNNHSSVASLCTTDFSLRIFIPVLGEETMKMFSNIPYFDIEQLTCLLRK